MLTKILKIVVQVMKIDQQRINVFFETEDGLIFVRHLLENVI